jgi:hypothetical protein
MSGTLGLIVSKGIRAQKVALGSVMGNCRLFGSTITCFEVTVPKCRICGT